MKMNLESARDPIPHASTLHVDTPRVGIPLLTNSIVVVSAIVLVGAAVRFFYIGGKSFWFDEARLFWMAQGTVSQVVAQNAAGNSAPPLYALLVHFVSMFSTSEIILRFLPNLFGIAAIPSIYLLARQFVGLYPAYFTAFLAAISAKQVYYSLELREYSLAFLLAVLSLLIFIRFLQRPNYRNWGILTAVFVLDIFAQYGLALLIFSLNVVFLLSLAFDSLDVKRWPWRTVIRWTVTQAVALAAVLVVYQLALKEQYVAGGFGSSGYLASGYWDFQPTSLIRLALFNTYMIFDFAWKYPSLILFLCGMGVLYTVGARSNRAALLLFILPTMVCFLAACLGVYPYYGDRQAMFLTPMIYVFAGIGLQALMQTGTSHLSTMNSSYIALLIFVVAGMSGTFYTVLEMRDPNEHVKPLIGILEESYLPDDRVLVGCVAEPAFRYYSRKQMSWTVALNRVQGVAPDELERIVEPPDRIWMLFSHCLEGEPTRLVTQIARLRTVELVAEQKGAWLYVVN